VLPSAKYYKPFSLKRLLLYLLDIQVFELMKGQNSFLNISVEIIQRLAVFVPLSFNPLWITDMSFIAFEICILLLVFFAALF